MEFAKAENQGLSPPVRGNRGGGGLGAGVAGSIPACAGEPRASTKTWHPCRVYPRLCGGTSRHRLFLTTKLGLSPPVRGNR